MLLIGILIARGPASEPQNEVAKIVHAHGIGVDIEDRSRVYVATHHGLLQLANGELSRVGESHDDMMGFSVDPRIPKRLYRSGHPMNGGNSGFQISEDGGKTWRMLSAGVNGPVDFHAMAVSPADPKVIYGWYAGALQISEDSGTTWRIAKDGIAIAGLIADPSDSNSVYALTRQGIQVSRDKGKAWEAVFSELGPVSALAVHANGEMLAFTSKGLMWSTDRGLLWSPLAELFSGDQIQQFALEPGGSRTLYALTSGSKVYKSSDFGTVWEKFH